ncbi:MAG TPA: cytochrome c oxidase subunit II [Polyangia bacterium]|jgi:cytochrome c oxidase subunit 2
MEPSNPFYPRSPQAGAIADLFTLSLVVLAGIVVLVVFLVVYIGIRFRARRAAAGEPAQVGGRLWLEVGWTLGPFALLAFLSVYTVRTMVRADPPFHHRPADVLVVGHQWWWELRYPSGIVTANEMHVPAGRQLVVRVESADVIHDFWVPQLARKIDATPGHPVHLWLMADRPGVYEGACAEYCGLQHAWMRIRVVADAPADFDAWQRRLLTPPPALQGDAARGAKLFSSKTCASCHAIAGTAATARFGPDLSHLRARQTLAGGVIANGKDGLARWLAAPERLKPGSYMPNLHLAPEEVRLITEYLWTER